VTVAVESVWDYPRPPRVEPSAALVVVTCAWRQLVSTRSAVRVLETSHPPVFYLPVADVAPGTLRRNPQRQSWCEFKGFASYWDVVVGDTVRAAAAWGYDDPSAGFEELLGRVAFYPARMDSCSVDGERVQAQEGDFYGGWITSAVAGPFKGGPGTTGW
jgi:uncharacterized protein (DUF427 family)